MIKTAVSQAADNLACGSLIITKVIESSHRSRESTRKMDNKICKRKYLHAEE